MSKPHTDTPSLSTLQARIDYAERVKTVTHRIHAASNLDELLVVTDEIKSLILSRAIAAESLTTARRQGLTTLMQDGMPKCIQGLTDYKQVQAVARR